MASETALQLERRGRGAQGDRVVVVVMVVVVVEEEADVRSDDDDDDDDCREEEEGIRRLLCVCFDRGARSLVRCVYSY
jgi:hypothetical protein